MGGIFRGRGFQVLGKDTQKKLDRQKKI